MSFQAASRLVTVTLVAFACGLGALFGFWPEIRARFRR